MWACLIFFVLFSADGHAIRLAAPDSKLCEYNLVVVGKVERRTVTRSSEITMLVTLAVEQTIHGRTRHAVVFGDDESVESPPSEIGTRLLLFLWEDLGLTQPVVADPYSGPSIAAWRELDPSAPLPDAAVAQAAWYSRCAPIVVHASPDRTYELLPTVADALQPANHVSQ
jgi:hypothetical protein